MKTSFKQLGILNQKRFRGTWILDTIPERELFSITLSDILDISILHNERLSILARTIDREDGTFVWVPTEFTELSFEFPAYMKLEDGVLSGIAPEHGVYSIGIGVINTDDDLIVDAVILQMTCGKQVLNYPLTFPDFVNLDKDTLEYVPEENYYNASWKLYTDPVGFQLDTGLDPSELQLKSLESFSFYTELTTGETVASNYYDSNANRAAITDVVTAMGNYEDPYNGRYSDKFPCGAVNSVLTQTGSTAKNYRTIKYYVPPDDPIYTISSNMTIGFVAAKRMASTQVIVVSGGGTNHESYAMYMDLTDTHVYVRSARDDNSKYRQNVIAHKLENVVANKFNHYTITKTGLNVKLYVNGIFSGSGTLNVSNVLPDNYTDLTRIDTGSTNGYKSSRYFSTSIYMTDLFVYNYDASVYRDNQWILNIDRVHMCQRSIWHTTPRIDYPVGIYFSIQDEEAPALRTELLEVVNFNTPIQSMLLGHPEIPGMFAVPTSIARQNPVVYVNSISTLNPFATNLVVNCILGGYSSFQGILTSLWNSGTYSKDAMLPDISSLDPRFSSSKSWGATNRGISVETDEYVENDIERDIRYIAPLSPISPVTINRPRWNIRWSVNGLLCVADSHKDFFRANTTSNGVTQPNLGTDSVVISVWFKRTNPGNYVVFASKGHNVSAGNAVIIDSDDRIRIRGEAPLGSEGFVTFETVGIIKPEDWNELVIAIKHTKQPEPVLVLNGVVLGSGDLSKDGICLYFTRHYGWYLGFGVRYDSTISTYLSLFSYATSDKSGVNTYCRIGHFISAVDSVFVDEVFSKDVGQSVDTPYYCKPWGIIGVPEFPVLIYRGVIFRDDRELEFSVPAYLLHEYEIRIYRKGTSAENTWTPILYDDTSGVWKAAINMTGAAYGDWVLQIRYNDSNGKYVYKSTNVIVAPMVDAA